MFTRKRLPNINLTGDWQNDGPRLVKWISDYLGSLEAPDSLTIDEAAITATNGIKFPSGTMADYAESSWTPTVTSGTGSFTTLGTVTGAYTKVGRVYIINSVVIPITTNGTAATDVRFTLPATATVASLFYGREDAATGAMLQGRVASSSNVVVIRDYANAYPGADGRRLEISGVFW